MIFAYVWMRFEWQFALGAIVSMIHDVFFTIGVFALFRLDFDLTTVAALLTILGYSINDTVVIYDRIRENLRRYKRMPLGDLLDLSVNETMSRTIMTVGTVFMALLALYWFGGEVIRGFTFAMLFGVLVGTYSSVFIAAPFLILIGVKRDWSGTDKAAAAKPGAAPGPRLRARLRNLSCSPAMTAKTKPVQPPALTARPAPRPRRRRPPLLRCPRAKARRSATPADATNPRPGANAKAAAGWGHCRGHTPSPCPSPAEAGDEGLRPSFATSAGIMRKAAR